MDDDLGSSANGLSAPLLQDDEEAAAASEFDQQQQQHQQQQQQQQHGVDTIDEEISVADVYEDQPGGLIGDDHDLDLHKPALLDDGATATGGGEGCCGCCGWGRRADDAAAGTTDEWGNPDDGQPGGGRCCGDCTFRWCATATLLLLGTTVFGGVGFLSVRCFIFSWTDRHHWWPLDASGHDVLTEYLRDPYCPAWYLKPWREVNNPTSSSNSNTEFADRWVALRMALLFASIAATGLALGCLSCMTDSTRTRLRELRLEHAYPWLSKRLGENSAYGKAAKQQQNQPPPPPLNDSSPPRPGPYSKQQPPQSQQPARSSSSSAAYHARSVSHSGAGAAYHHATTTRRQGRRTFASKFSARMSQVHDSTLMVGMEFRNLSVKGGGKKLLHNVNGEVRARHLTAIMGPSGAGKSTLLHTLCGRLAPLAGSEITLNNSTRNSIAQMSKLVGFVPQDDILMASLTVKETLRFHASLRLPVHIVGSEGNGTKERWIDDCIDLLGLTDVKHSIVGDENRRGISGGQRKRVNIGAELVSDPSILFCDEPTSGLDSSAALEVINCLKLAAQEGMTVVAVIHQPRTSVFELFDDLILLGRSSATLGGRTVYSGPANAAQRYFEYRGFLFSPQENPADLFIDIVSGSYSFDSRVVLKGMTGERKAELNGELGTAGAFDEVAGAYSVQLDAGGPPRLIKCSNLAPAPAGSPPPPDPSSSSHFHDIERDASGDGPTATNSSSALLTPPKRAVANQQPAAPFSGGPQINLGDAWQQLIDAHESAAAGGVGGGGRGSSQEQQQPLQAAAAAAAAEEQQQLLVSDVLGGDTDELSAGLAAFRRASATAAEKNNNGLADSSRYRREGNGTGNGTGDGNDGDDDDDDDDDDENDLMESGGGGGGGGGGGALAGLRDGVSGGGPGADEVKSEDEWFPRRASASLRELLFASDAQSGLLMNDGGMVNEATAAAKNVLGSAMSMLAIRLKDHQGRRTCGGFRQLLMFTQRQALQNARQMRLLVKNTAMFMVAGLILGALYGDVLKDWPRTDPGFCPLTDDEVNSVDDDRWKQDWRDNGGHDSECTQRSMQAGGGSVPKMEPNDCQSTLWPAIQRDMDLQYRQVFTLALLALALLSVQSSLDLFADERLVFFRECRHHSVWSYVVGKTLAMVPLSCFYPFVFGATFHTLLNPMASFLDYYWVFLATGVAAESMGVMLSVMFPDTRQVAGGVAVLAMSMFTGCFPLFSENEGSKGLAFLSFLRYSAQLIFRFEYLAYTGYRALPFCAYKPSDWMKPPVLNGDEDNRPFDKCIDVSPYAGQAFWLLPDEETDNSKVVEALGFEAEHYPVKSFKRDCPLPWEVPYSNFTSTDDDDDDMSIKIWNYQCCGVNLFLKVAKLVETNYGYSMAPDFSFAKLVSFAVVFRILTSLVLVWKRYQLKR